MYGILTPKCILWREELSYVLSVGTQMQLTWWLNLTSMDSGLYCSWKQDIRCLHDQPWESFKPLTMWSNVGGGSHTPIIMEWAAKEGVIAIGNLPQKYTIFTDLGQSTAMTSCCACCISSPPNKWKWRRRLSISLAVHVRTLTSQLVKFLYRMLGLYYYKVN